MVRHPAHSWELPCNWILNDDESWLLKFHRPSTYSPKWRHKGDFSIAKSRHLGLLSCLEVACTAGPSYTSHTLPPSVLRLDRVCHNGLTFLTFGVKAAPADDDDDQEEEEEEEDEEEVHLGADPSNPESSG